jgi:hypothetical protein
MPKLLESTDDDLLPGGERDDRIWRDFNVLNQIRVQHHRNVVEPRQLNHAQSLQQQYRRFSIRGL